MSEPRDLVDSARIHLRASLDARAVDEQRFHIRQAMQYLQGTAHVLSVADGEGEREREPPRQS